MIGAFLDHLERERRVTVRTRNVRLAAIHSLFRFAALRHPEHAALIQRVLAIPQKRYERNDISFLNPDETEALLEAPDRSTWIGRRDHALLMLAIQTGLRVFGAHRPAGRGPRVAHQRSRHLQREGMQGPQHAADTPDRADHARLAPGPARRT